MSDFIIEDGILKEYEGEGVEILNDVTYYKCAESIVIPDGVTYIGDNVFKYCSSLRKIEIPSGVTTIGTYAFWGCSSLKKVKIPSSVTIIEDFAFYECRSLERVEISSGVTTIGNSVFRGCSSLQEIIFDKCICELVLQQLYDNSSNDNSSNDNFSNDNFSDDNSSDEKILIYYSILKYMPEFIQKDKQKCEELKKEKTEIFKWACKLEDAETIDKLFSLCGITEFDSVEEITPDDSIWSEE